MAAGSNIAAKPRPALEARAVSKDFFLLESVSVWALLSGRHDLPAHRALNEITMSVPRGEIIGVLGHNGAGKSTLLRTLGGVYSPSRGFVTARGDMSAIFELGIACNEFLTGRQFTERAFTQMGGVDDILEPYLVAVEEFAELAEHFDMAVKTYSAGMKARLFFAVATSFRKSIFLIDEVLSVGDNYFRARCWRRLRDFKRRGVSGVLATHDWTSVLKLCEQCYVLDHGQVVLKGDSYPVVREYLGYSPPASRSDVWFDETMPQEYRGAAEKEVRLDFPVYAEEPAQINFGISIELTHRSVGWEHMMLLDPVEVTLAKGKSVLTVRIPSSVLVPGKYMLHAFMLRRAPGSGEIIEVDARTWYHGNPLALVIEGEEQSGVVKFLPVARVRRRKP